jgi:hypothetical protein
MGKVQEALFISILHDRRLAAQIDSNHRGNTEAKAWNSITIIEGTKTNITRIKLKYSSTVIHFESPAFSMFNGAIAIMKLCYLHSTIEKQYISPTNLSRTES